MYSILFVFFFLCLCFCFLSCLFLKNKKFSSDYWGSKKGVLPPILIIGGCVPGLPPRVYAYDYGPHRPPLYRPFRRAKYGKPWTLYSSYLRKFDTFFCLS